MKNGGGRPEIEAAHIKAVEDGGPDSIRNGLALSRSIHWMFDRGIVSLGNEGQILIADKYVPERMQMFLNPDGYARLPENSRSRPHPQFLKWHRENRYVG